MGYGRIYVRANPKIRFVYACTLLKLVALSMLYFSNFELPHLCSNNHIRINSTLVRVSSLFILIFLFIKICFFRGFYFHDVTAENSTRKSPEDIFFFGFSFLSAEVKLFGLFISDFSPVCKVFKFFFNVTST